MMNESVNFQETRKVNDLQKNVHTNQKRLTTKEGEGRII
jgi:hypothetical protein